MVFFLTQALGTIYCTKLYCILPGGQGSFLPINFLTSQNVTLQLIAALCKIFSTGRHIAKGGIWMEAIVHPAYIEIVDFCEKVDFLILRLVCLNKN